MTKMASQLIEYIEGLTLAQGRYEGQPFRLHQWERRFIRGAFGTDGDAGLSVARGNGKSTLIAAICCVALDGPLVVNHAETVVAANSFDQDRIIFDHVKAFMADRKRWRVQDSTNRAIITCRRTGVSVRCIGPTPSGCTAGGWLTAWEASTRRQRIEGRIPSWRPGGGHSGPAGPCAGPVGCARPSAATGGGLRN